MSNCLYSKKNYKLIQFGKNSYIVINTLKDFKHGHTHVNNYYIGKIIIYRCIKGTFPDKCKRLSLNRRIMESVQRII